MTRPAPTPLLRKLLSVGFAALLVGPALASAGCSDPAPEPAKKDASSDASETTVGDIGDTTGDSAVDPDIDTGATDTAGNDGPGTDAVDTGADSDVPVDIAQCTTASDCEGVVNPTNCQQAACEAGQCKAAAKPLPFCCNDSACDDKDECTEDSCDPATAKCENKVDPKCCTGKQTMFKSGFEAASLGDLKISDGAGNGGVTWSQSTARAHSGKASLYFGNACKTYDTSMTVDGGCKAGKDGQAVSTALTSGEFLLPSGTVAHVQFWLWLDAEPPLSANFSPGNCATACPQNASCVIVNGASQCLPERDVLTVNLLQGGKTIPLFSSLSIGKTTAGNWQQIALDLSAFGGSAAKLQWQFSSGTALKNQYEGIYLDDVVIETVCAQNACSPTAPCADDGNACSTNPCTPYNNGKNGAGACLYSAIPGCCADDGDCKDDNACTVDSCKQGQCSFAPDSSKPTCCKTSVPFGDDFDGGSLSSVGWTALEQNSTAVQWRLLSATSGSALAFVNEAGTSYADETLSEEVGAKGTLCSPNIQLKQGTLFNLLTFHLKLETEWSGTDAKSYKNPPVEGLPKYDAFSVQVLVDSQLQTAWSSDAIYGTTGGNWQPITVSLDAWAGKKVQVCLNFDAGDGSKNDYTGAWVEDLAVKVACSKQACYLDSECAAKSCGACEVAKCDSTAGCTCAKVAGCCAGDGDCTDTDPCTTDVCVSGVCKNTKVDNCCTTDAACDDKDACTTDACTALVCKHAPIPDCKP